jgi:hypothetical protein
MNVILNSQALSLLKRLAEIEAVLESRPLPTEEYACALNHLKNARNYFQQGELGAGMFEMKLLNAKLKEA